MPTAKPTSSIERVGPALGLCVALAAGGCGFFDDTGNDDFDDTGDTYDTYDTYDTNETDTGDPPPEQGFLVLPKYLLTDVAAVVTVEDAATNPQSCELNEAAAGGYICDTGGLAGPTVTIAVTRDGFETAERHPEIPFGTQILPLDVHLAVAGGSPGTWSDCVVVGSFETCNDICSDQGRTCQPASCTTGDPESPLATSQTFSGSECVELSESVVSSCSDLLPQELPVGSLHCCCVD